MFPLLLSALLLLLCCVGGHHVKDGLPTASPGGVGAGPRRAADPACVGDHP